MMQRNHAPPPLSKQEQNIAHSPRPTTNSHHWVYGLWGTSPSSLLTHATRSRTHTAVINTTHGSSMWALHGHALHYSTKAHTKACMHRVPVHASMQAMQHVLPHHTACAARVAHVRAAACNLAATPPLAQQHEAHSPHQTTCRHVPHHTAQPHPDQDINHCKTRLCISDVLTTPRQSR